MVGAVRLLRGSVAALALAALASCAGSGTGHAARWGNSRMSPVKALAAGGGARRAEAARLNLAAQRAAFIESRDPALVFAVFYHHVTEGILAKIGSGTLHHREFWLDEVATFYADYALNSDSRSRKDHWLGYYHRADEIRGGEFRISHVADPADLFTARSLAGHGIVAHIGVDLPRTLAEVAARHPQAGAEWNGRLEADFWELSSVFRDASRRGFDDLVAVFGPRQTLGLDLIPFRDHLAAWRIAGLRNQAWRKAGRDLQEKSRRGRSHIGADTL